MQEIERLSSSGPVRRLVTILNRVIPVILWLINYLCESIHQLQEETLVCGINLAGPCHYKHVSGHFHCCSYIFISFVRLFKYAGTGGKSGGQEC